MNDGKQSPFDLLEILEKGEILLAIIKKKEISLLSATNLQRKDNLNLYYYWKDSLI